MTSSKAGALIRHSSDGRRGLLINWSAVQNFARGSSPLHFPTIAESTVRATWVSRLHLDESTILRPKLNDAHGFMRAQFLAKSAELLASLIFRNSQSIASTGWVEAFRTHVARDLGRGNHTGDRRRLVTGALPHHDHGQGSSVL